MSKLKMPLEDVKKQLRFNPRNFWNNILSTNCYAYALGIDILKKRLPIKHIYLEQWAQLCLEFIQIN